MSEQAPRTIRILVVDDHTLFRRGLTALLSRTPHHQVVGDAADAGQAQRREADQPGKYGRGHEADGDQQREGQGFDTERDRIGADTEEGGTRQ